MRFLVLSSALRYCWLLMPAVVYGQYHPTPVTEEVILERTTTINTDQEVGAIPGTAAVSAIGAATYTIPIPVSPGTGGMQPNIALSYNSNGGNGPLGRGWSLAGVSTITRAGQDQLHDGAVSPISLSAEDRFALDGQRLVRRGGAAYGINGCQYDTEQLSHALIEQFGTMGNGPERFTVIQPNGQTWVYGGTTESRVVVNGTVVIWRLNRVTDASGNYMTYTYEEDGLESRLMRIDYTGNDNLGMAPYNAVRFHYVTRATSDKDEYYLAGALRRNSTILDKINVDAENGPRDFYLINYELRDQGRTFLREVTHYGMGYGVTSQNTTLFKYGDLIDESDYADFSLTDFNEPEPPYMTWDENAPSIPQLLFSKADFDGDGRDELVTAKFTQDEEFYQIAHLNEFKVLRWNGSTFDHCAAVSTPDAVLTGLPNLPNAAVLATGDFDGDGRDDVLTPWLGGSVVLGIRISYSQGGCTFVNQVHPVPYEFDRVHLLGHFITTGDFNADGIADYVLFTHSVNNSSVYKAFFSSPGLGIFNQELTSPDLSPIALAEATRLFSGDTDGDGASELIAITNNFTVSTLDVGTTSITERTQQVLDIDTEVLLPGDYNGDGLLDLWGRDITTLTNWAIFYGNGKPTGADAGFTKVALPGGGNTIPHDVHAFAADMDADGRSEMIRLTENIGSMYRSAGALDAFTATQIYTGQFGDHGDWRAPRMAYDLNGDSHQDLVIFQTEIVAWLRNQVYFYQKDRTGQFMEATVDGMARLTRFEMESIANLNCTIHGNGSLHQYPVHSIQPALHVVKAMHTSNGIGGLNETQFVYWDAQAHANRGFLGFRQRLVKDIEHESSTYTDLQYNATVKGFLPWKVINNVSSNGISHTELSLLPAGDPVTGYWMKTLEETTTSPLTGVQQVLTNHDWNAFGLVEHSTLTINDVAETETWTSYVAAGPSAAQVLPEVVDVKVTRAGQPPLTESTYADYDNQGRLLETWAHVGTEAELITHHDIDPLSGVIKETISTFPGATSAEERRTRFDHDDKHRFITHRNSWWVDPQSGMSTWIPSSATFDPAWGKPLSTLGADGLTVLHEYDLFGNLIRTSLPHEAGQLRGWIEYARDWAVDMPAHQFYRETVTHPCEPETEIHYDQLGRVIRSASETVSHDWSTATSEYNAKGQLIRSTAPRLSSEPVNETLFAYDDPFDRLTEAVNTVTGTTTTAYSHDNALARLTTEVTNDAGQWSRRITDATGKVVRAADDGGDLRYTYDSRGQVIQIRHGTLEVMSATYDDAGRQSSLTDPGAGTNYYAYNPFGDLMRQVNGNGHQVDLSYDNLGRLVQRENPVEGITTYEYFHGNDRFTNALSRVEGLGTIINNDYSDPYNRLVSSKHSINGEDFETSYTYDLCDRSVSVKYPTELLVERDFTEDGFLNEVWQGGTSLFLAGEMNGQGQYLNYTYGDGTVITIERENGYPLTYKALNGSTEVFDLHQSFDYSTGTLEHRWDGLVDRKEIFLYDELNRLTMARLYEVDASGQEVVGVSSSSVEYDGTIGQYTRGNITRKQDIGQFGYNGHQIRSAHGLSYPSPPDAPPFVINLEAQHIDYTPFSQPEKITEKVDGAEYILDLSYGPNQQRNRSVLRKDGVEQEERIYLGRYERQSFAQSGDVNHLHYVHGGDGLCAIIVVNDGQTSVHHVHKDHLGSISKVTRMNGQQLVVTATQSFDPWGRPRDPDEWAQTGTPSVPAWLYRGFTGHEHMAPFGLINMNGRVYDPLLGRMTAADKYAGDGLSSSRLNRYCYAMNSPTNLVDPDGNNPAGMVAGILMSGLMNALQSGLTYSIVATANQTLNGEDLWNSLRAGFISGLAGGLVSQTLGPIVGNNLALDIMSSGATYIAGTLANGGNVTSGGVAGSIVGGYAAQQFGTFYGVPGGSAAANIVGEIAFNTAKFAVAGAHTGAIAAALDGGDPTQGMISGAIAGAIGGAGQTLLTIGFMGPTYIPDGLGRVEDLSVYRSGHAGYGDGTGLAMGRNTTTRSNPDGRTDYWEPDYNAYLQAHERGHIYQMRMLGHGRFYGRRMVEGWNALISGKSSYTTPGTLEMGAEVYSLKGLGYYFLTKTTSINAENWPWLFPIPAMY